MHIIKRTAVVAAATVGLLLTANSAMAVAWFSQSAPLRVYEDGGVTQGAGYGNFYNANGVYARNATTRKDFKPGGDGIFVDTKFYWYQNAAGEGWGYYQYGSDQTERTTSGKWANENSQKALVADATQARGHIKVCEDHSWSWDPCSSTVLRTFSY